MLLDLIAVMWKPVLASGVVMFIVGFLWYGPLFGKKWLELSGIPMPENKPPMKSMYGKMLTHLVLTILESAALFLFVLIPSSLSVTIYFTLFAFVGFYVPRQISDHLWSNKKLGLVAFDLSATLASLLLAVLTLFYVARMLIPAAAQ
jgi:hypothetical protein